MTVKTGDPEKPFEQRSMYDQRSSGLTSSAVLEYGKPLTVASLNQRKLELTVTKGKPSSPDKK
jgi:hypothetical protein